MKITTVIPFYQREPGLLTRAVESALGQVGAFDHEVVVVDDGCPYVNAGAELERAGYLADRRVSVIEQRNAGVAAARNRAIDARSDSTDAIAFLDSDDVWKTDHLQKACAVLARGTGFYFADHRREDWTETKFEMLDFRKQLVAGTRFDLPGDIHAFEGDVAYLCLSSHLVQTSTVVCTREALGDVRFPEDMALLEDDCTWARIARNGATFAVSAEVDVVLGSGVNLSLSGGWGSASSLSKQAKLLKSWKKVRQLLELDSRLEDLERQRIDMLRIDIARHVLKGSLGRARFSPAVMELLPEIVVGIVTWGRQRGRGLET